ncbi:unnamed protein product, partial [Staurois parvus]
VTRHQVFGSTAGHRRLSGKAVVSESTGTTVGTGSSGTRIVWLDSGHRVIRYDSGTLGSTRHQVILLASGPPASSGKAVGTEVTRYRIIWINSGHRVNWPNRSFSWISSSCTE